MRVFRLKAFCLEHPLVLGGTERAADYTIPSVIGSFRKISVAGRSKRRRLSWDPSLGPDQAGYRIYWALAQDVGYDSDFLDVGNVTSIILPDDLPWSREIRGRVEIGVTAISSGGNESDMSIVSFFCDFGTPEGPTNLRLEHIPDDVANDETGSWSKDMDGKVKSSRCKARES